jgi:hypothetical protein
MVGDFIKDYTIILGKAGKDQGEGGHSWRRNLWDPSGIEAALSWVFEYVDVTYTHPHIYILNYTLFLSG